VDVLLWSYHDSDVSAAPTPVSITIDGLTGREVLLSESLMDASHSNAYTAWMQMGSPAHPSAQQIDQLQKEGSLEDVAPNPHASVDNGKVNLTISLPRQGVMLIRLRMHHLRV
jgi:xylan 1,4-beta-xylosidase